MAQRIKFIENNKFHKTEVGKGVREEHEQQIHCHNFEKLKAKKQQGAD